MTCPKQDTCAGYPRRCQSCKSVSSPFNSYPDFIDKTVCKQKFKIFTGTQNSPADYYANLWLSQNPDVTILHMGYAEAENRRHSICILYKET